MKKLMLLISLLLLMSCTWIEQEKSKVSYVKCTYRVETKVWTFPAFGNIEESWYEYDIPKSKIDSVKKEQYHKALKVKARIKECRKNKCRKDNCK